MTTLELAIMSVGEAATAAITRAKDAQGFDENLEAAKEGGESAGNTRRDIEKKTGIPVVTNDNFLGNKKK